MKRLEKVAAMLVAFAALSFSTAAAREKICRTQEEVNAPFCTRDINVFANPEKLDRPETWFHFIDGNVDKEGITKDLEAIAAAGISGIHLFHGGSFGGDWPGTRQHIECLSPLWDDAVAHTASEAKRLGLRFTMQNCPGWSLAGGPWITPRQSMRDIVCSRTDIEGGHTLRISLPLPAECDKPWRDYADIAVIAFPTPDGDIEGPAVPADVTADSDAEKWSRLLAGNSGEVKLKPSKADSPHRIRLNYDKAVTLRSIVFSPIQQFNHSFCFEPGIRVVVRAFLPDGSARIVLDTPMPMSNWQDNKEMTFALDESTADAYEISIFNAHDMNVSGLKVLSGARKNNWEALAARTLRANSETSEHPVQSPSAYILKDDILDLTGFVSADGKLEWKAPKGKWSILRIGHVNTGYRNGPAPAEATGWECNKLSGEGADTHFAAYIGKLADGPVHGMLDAMLLDSWECNSQTWTEGMEDIFDTFNGYPLRQWLPALFGYVVDNHETTSDFLYDWRSCINKLFTENFFGRMAANAASKDLNIIYETAAGDVFPADILEYFKYTEVPMCEFWNDHRPGYVGSFNFKPIRPTVSAARLYGKTRVSAESFTSFELTWDEHLSRLKDLANQNASHGVTHTVFHTYTHNPCADSLFPGTSFGGGIGTPFLRGQTWWKHMPEFTGFLARMNYMLERGLPVSDVLWFLGDGYMHKPDQEFPFPDGFKYDYCNTDVLLHRLDVKDGKLVTPEGISYSILWIPSNRQMLPATAAAIRRLVEKGATVVADAPECIGSLVTSAVAEASHGVPPESWKADVEVLWGNAGKGIHNVGNGRMVSGISLENALQLLGLYPDLTAFLPDGDSTNGGGASLPVWLHRKVEGADIYFVAAPPGKGFNGSVRLSCTGDVTIWDPTDGKIGRTGWNESDGHTEVELDLPHAASCFIVVSHDDGKALSDITAISRYARNASGSDDSKSGIRFTSPWTLYFPDGWGAPTRLTIDSLKAWKELPMTAEGKAFSGTVTYTNSLNIKKLHKEKRYFLHLGTVEEIARVRINGTDCGTLWCEPYETDVTDALRKGSNEISIEVTGTWFNRLVYDASQPEENRKTWTIKGPAATETLRDNGLLGPEPLLIVK